MRMRKNRRNRELDGMASENGTALLTFLERLSARAVGRMEASVARHGSRAYNGLEALPQAQDDLACGAVSRCRTGYVYR